MITEDPVHRLTADVDLSDIRQLAERPGPFASIVLPSPSGDEHAAVDLSIHWKNAHRELESSWPAERLAELEAVVEQLAHHEADSFQIVQASDGHVFIEDLGFGVTTGRAVVADHPKLAPLIESRQRMLPHIVVVTDRAGADLMAFDGGAVVHEETVEGDTTNIHRGHPGGWSQRRFQQRAENKWEENAGEVADHLNQLIAQFDPRLIAISGDVRASNLLADELAGDASPRVELLDSGSPESITEEVMTLLADEHARNIVDILNAFGDASGNDRSVEGADVLNALEEGRVETLLVTPKGAESTSDSQIDQAVSAALKTSTNIVVVPGSSRFTGPIAGMLRW